MYNYTYISVYMYTYIERERERERDVLRLARRSFDEGCFDGAPVREKHLQSPQR